MFRIIVNSSYMLYFCKATYVSLEESKLTKKSPRASLFFLQMIRSALIFFLPISQCYLLTGVPCNGRRLKEGRKIEGRGTDSD